MPASSDQASTALEVSSVPSPAVLEPVAHSLATADDHEGLAAKLGNPRDLTRAPEMDVSTVSARHSRGKSSTAVKNPEPPAVRQHVVHKVHRPAGLDPAGLWEVPVCRSRACARRDGARSAASRG